MSNLTARLDRIQLIAWPGKTPPSIDGFELKWDRWVKRQTTVSTYARSRYLQSLTNDAKVYWQYQPLQGWLKPWRITIIADDVSGLTRNEIGQILKLCQFYRLLLVEVAIDFSPSTGVNKHFVRQHAIFGKSHRRAKKKESRFLLR